VFVPWSAISAVLVVESFGNPAVSIDLHDDEAVQARPADRLEKVHAELRRNRSWTGTPLLILTSPYEIAAPELALTIQSRLP
jgi:hypothetical protein